MRVLLQIFFMLEELLSHSEAQSARSLSKEVQKKVSEHLETLQNSFEGYFCPESLNQETWVRSPFMMDMNDINDEDLIKDDLIDIRSKAVLRAEFNAKAVCNFWCSLGQAYPPIVKCAMSILIPFATTYLCESEFSVLLSIKTSFFVLRCLRQFLNLMCLSKGSSSNRVIKQPSSANNK